MARRGNKNRGQRDDLSSLDSLLAPLTIPKPIRVTTPLPETWREIQDDRLWSPEPFSQARTFSGSDASTRRIPKSRNKFLSHQIGFDNPDLVLNCVRRKQRREVIFAKRKRRQGSGARRRRRNFYSNIRC